MTWNASKSFVLSQDPPPFVFRIDGQILGHHSVVTYLGISLSISGVTYHRLLACLTAAQQMTHMMRRQTRSVRLSYAQKQAMAQKFILSLVMYVLYLQLFDELVEIEAQKLEKQLTRWIFGVRTQGVYWFKVGRALLQFPTLRTRRRIQAATLLTKLRTRALRSPTVSTSETQKTEFGP